MKLQRTKWRTSWGGEWVGGAQIPTEPEKDCCRKMMLFLKALFLATQFLKNR